ncbi:Predicted acyltransferase [Catalinimonas alkaloidigena]|uniref:Predicted acyltransferase n=1 Tax=Catalinimonas alkaloidigena TaxID=1075417 RepID=A0A1G9SFW3_9BACT|nr:DUF5009 domain-containing protein [Catalinimonas alkaloidigena]SDM33675.1 Predicted acyltransferase [Catalinimonas alkaloidigena]
MSQPLTISPAPPPASALQATPTRLASIDILRALTMVLMIFVNDLWSLRDVPTWLEHVPAGVDGMGLADTVFPAFLFIMGMSIPFAIASRRKKGEREGRLVLHVLSRTLALLVMGVFLVNGENLHEAATGMPRVVWNTLACLSFILIWHVDRPGTNLRVHRGLQLVGVAILMTLAILYRGEAGTTRFSTYWWGILGLIGWSYVVSALVMVAAKERFWVPLVAWGVFTGLSMLASAGLVPDGGGWDVIPGAIRGGTLVAFSLGGVLTTLLFQYFQRRQAMRNAMLTFGALALTLLILGFVTRPLWGISKIGATAPWLFLCSGLTLLAFMAVYGLVDVAGKARWFQPLRPAGTDTLLCYLIPYFAYAFVVLLGIHWPGWMLTGAVGLLKAFAFALLCVGITYLLRRIGIRLKI